MPKYTKSSGAGVTLSRAESITEDTFHGLNISSLGSEAIIRNGPPPKGTLHDQLQKEHRETLKKTECDMHRRLLSMVSKALNNNVQLPFYVSEFEKAKSTIRINRAGAFRNLSDESRRLTVKGGPAVITDLTGAILLWYFPYFIGQGLQKNLIRCIADLTDVYRPPVDSIIKDCRAATQGCTTGTPCRNTGLRQTRSKTAQSAAVVPPVEEYSQPEEEHDTAELITIMEGQHNEPEAQPSVEAYEEDDGEVRLAGQTTLPSKSDETPPIFGLDSQCRLSKHPPFAYYWSPGWSQTGMHFKLPIQMSSHFQNALTYGLNETVRVLEAKRLLDRQLASLTEIIQPSLYRSMQELRLRMSAVKGASGTTVTNGWTSMFPCYGIAINRAAKMHRDTNGIRAGLDIIGVLGTFTHGGDLELPDLNLTLEWKPGCLSAFDGYDFRHKVHPWEGGSRVALISFCRKSTWNSCVLRKNDALLLPERHQV
ncbi:hypothetical protein BN14_08421 [Rhizoctonia solani AG-1 IB]|uniref:2OGFeDO JBP1/TET oxygenase domain-containing protein n=1 Tax=Thanatephorus cucumeris (strain AG1-IB / isolate 7/3/14) TaxID=1108050 RepID=M5C4S1_THACB|nr:hypothetical protein BN14_08421 [Rhizoctonia solani AG-1 IB]